MQVTTSKQESSIPLVDVSSAFRLGRWGTGRDLASMRQEQSPVIEVTFEGPAASGYIPVEGILTYKPLDAANALEGSREARYFLRLRDDYRFTPSTKWPEPIPKQEAWQTQALVPFEEPPYGSLFDIVYRPRHRRNLNELLEYPRKTPRKETTSGEWQELESRIREFRMRLGWDGYNAAPPSEKAVGKAIDFLKALRVCAFLPARVTSSVVGGIGISFRNESRKVYVEFYNSGAACVLFSDGVSEPEVTDVETTYGGFLSTISQARRYLDVQSSAGDILQ